MALLRNKVNNKEIMLFAQHLFGRNMVHSQTKIPFKDVSNSHATIRFQNNVWVITDHSKNGTIVDKQFICKDSLILSKTGTIIQFGSHEETKWEIINLNPPSSFLQSKDMSAFIELEEFHPFYEERLPDALIFRTNFDDWIYEYHKGAVILTHGIEITIRDRDWTFYYNDLKDETCLNESSMKNSLDQFCFEFNVSADEENVSLDIRGHQSKFSIEERAHHYLILTLARIRLADHLEGVCTEKQGWVTLQKLENMLLLSKDHLNIQIFRFRQQLAKFFSHQLSDIIERKAGEIRFGCRQIKILKGQELEGEVLIHSI